MMHFETIDHDRKTDAVMCGGKSQDNMIGIDGASGALTGKVIDITKKK
jgi:hypothetical protein